MMQNWKSDGYRSWDGGCYSAYSKDVVNSFCDCRSYFNAEFIYYKNKFLSLCYCDNKALTKSEYIKWLFGLFNKFCLKKIINLFLKFQNLFSPPLKGCTVPARFRHAQTENIEPQKSKLNYFKLLFFNF